MRYAASVSHKCTPIIHPSVSASALTQLTNQHRHAPTSPAPPTVTSVHNTTADYFSVGASKLCDRQDPGPRGRRASPFVSYRLLAFVLRGESRFYAWRVENVAGIWKRVYAYLGRFLVFRFLFVGVEGKTVAMDFGVFQGDDSPE